MATISDRRSGSSWSRIVEISAIMCTALAAGVTSGSTDGSSSDITGSMTATATGGAVGQHRALQQRCVGEVAQAAVEAAVRAERHHEQLHTEVAQRRRPGWCDRHVVQPRRALRRGTGDGVDQHRLAVAEPADELVPDVRRRGRRRVEWQVGGRHHGFAGDSSPQALGEVGIVGQHGVDQLRRDAQRERDVDSLGEIGERSQLLVRNLALRVGRQRGDLVHARDRRQRERTARDLVGTDTLEERCRRRRRRGRRAGPRS